MLQSRDDIGPLWQVSKAFSLKLAATKTSAMRTKESSQSLVLRQYSLELLAGSSISICVCLQDVQLWKYQVTIRGGTEETNLKFCDIDFRLWN